MIQDGETLLRELDRQNFPVDAMFSLNAPEKGYWRLIIGSPFVEEQGTRAGYQRLREIYAKLDLQGLALGDISLLDPLFLTGLMIGSKYGDVEPSAIRCRYFGQV